MDTLHYKLVAQIYHELHELQGTCCPKITQPTYVPCFHGTFSCQNNVLRFEPWQTVCGSILRHRGMQKTSLNYANNSSQERCIIVV